jgi:hypothetical protein
MPDAGDRRNALRFSVGVDASVIFYTRAASCWLPRVKSLTIMVNSLFNGWRFEDVWLDK